MTQAPGRKTKETETKTEQAPPPGGAPFVGEIADGVARLRREVLEYVAIRVARLKLSLSQALLRAVALLLGIVLVVASVVTAVVFICAGIAAGLGEATARPWLGSLLAGCIGLLIVTIGWLAVRRVLMRRAAKEASEGIDEKRT